MNYVLVHNTTFGERCRFKGLPLSVIDRTLEQAHETFVHVAATTGMTPDSILLIPMTRNRRAQEWALLCRFSTPTFFVEDIVSLEGIHSAMAHCMRIYACAAGNQRWDREVIHLRAAA